MRGFILHLIAVVLAWCIGFQPVAAAMGAPCTHGNPSEAALTTDDGAHAMHLMHERSAHEGHGAQPGVEHESLKTEKHCACGCDCGAPDCVGTASAVGPTSAMHRVDDASNSFLDRLTVSSLDAAHGLGLIRPPSKP